MRTLKGQTYNKLPFLLHMRVGHNLGTFQIIHFDTFLRLTRMHLPYPPDKYNDMHKLLSMPQGAVLTNALKRTD